MKFCESDYEAHQMTDVKYLNWLEDLATLRTQLAAMTAERDAERAKVAVLEVDAARYRWLRGNQDPGHRYLEMEVRAWSTDHQKRVWFVDVEPDDLDRRIDDSIARNALEKTR